MDVNGARAEAAPENVAALLRERIYGGIACLSTLLLLLRYPAEEQSASARWWSSSGRWRITVR